MFHKNKNSHSVKRRKIYIISLCLLFLFLVFKGAINQGIDLLSYIVFPVQRKIYQIGNYVKETKEAVISYQRVLEENRELKNEHIKYEMLVSHGYSPEYLNLHYNCPKCKDTGFIGIEKCSCFKSKLVKLYYKDSELEEAVKTNNFKNFNINLYSNHKLNDERYTPRKNIEDILEYITGEYLPNFKNSNTNLLFYGNSGTGKTFLSWCIAKELLDKGFLVVYKTSDDLLRALKDIKFNNDTDLENLLINCDLLIIDDLGSEQITDFSSTELFTLIYKKILKNKKMLISTNLSLPLISKRYSERISSRIIGEFKLFKFFAEDIRIQLNLKRQK